MTGQTETAPVRTKSHKKEKQKKVMGLVIQWASFAVAAALIVAAFVKTTQESRTDSVDFNTAAEAVSVSFLSSLEDPSKVTLGDAQAVARFYGLDVNDMEGVVLYVPASSMDAEEVILIKARSRDQMEQIRSALESRKAQQLKTFEGYGIEQTAMLEKAQIRVQGTFALFVCSPDPSAVVKTFEDMLP